jgi:trimethylamine-N-oxide reductase (cytochrome c)
MGVSRRKFLQLSAATAAASVAPLTIFSPDAVFGEDTLLIPHASHYGPFKAVVRNGRLIGVQPLEDVDAMPTEMLTEGVLSRTYHRTRVMYPMVRKSYLENFGGFTHPERRGKEPFVRVTWDEALGLTAGAVLDTIERFDNEAVFSSSYGGWSHAGVLRPNVLQGRMFGLIGGCTTTTGDYSGGASQISLPHVIGDMEVYSAQTAWEEIRDNTEIFVLVGCDPFKNNRIEYRVADHQMYPRWKEIKESGVKFVSINPQYTLTDDALASEWVKIIPNTDTALFLAMAYHIVKSGKQDQEYLDKYTVGFDKVRAYLMGEDADGSPPKTPAWAAKLTGIPAEKIVEMAELFASKRTQFAGAWSLQRADHGEMTHWAIINFAAIIGKIGKPGGGVGFSWHYGNGGMPQSGGTMPVGLPQGRNPVKTRCPASRISEMLMNPGAPFQRDGHLYTYPRVRMIYNAGVNYLSHQQDTNELIWALRKKVDTIVCQDPWWTASMQYADIVLPATSTLERNDMSSGGTYSNNKVYAMRQAIEPVGESLDDFEIFRRLAAIFGVEQQFTDGKTVMDVLKGAYEGCSAEMPFEEFWEKGVAPVTVPEAANQWVRHGDFYNDPEEHPLHTVSGKIELYCNTIAGFDIPDCPPMPKWMEPFEYLGNAKPGQVHVVSPHPRMRLHSQMANATIRNIDNIKGREFIFISPEDAKKRGIEDGDLIEVYNDRGALIGGARVWDKIMKGVLSIQEGVWLRLDSKGRCNSGAINTITTSKACSQFSQATSANTCLAWVKKCTDPEGENLAYFPPEILMPIGKVDLAKLDIQTRAGEIKATASADMSPGEKLFYERCTLCHVPREPGDYSKKQWQGITQSMFPRAGLDEEQRKIVLDFLFKNAKDAI